MSRIYSCTAVKASSLTPGGVGDLERRKNAIRATRIFLAGKSMTSGKKEKGFFSELRNDQLLTKTKVFHFTPKKLISLVMLTNDSGVDSTFSLKKNAEGNDRQQELQAEN